MSNVKSVYNFVPAPSEKEVFKPDWANQVSHDIPFKDGESGEIEIELEAKTPIFIRNGHTREDAENETERYLQFSKHNGKYFIPATSIKGMVRSVMEIMSFSPIKQVADNKYSYRDLTPDSDYMKNYETNHVFCGWLKEDEGGEWFVEDCDKPALIHHEHIDEILETNFRQLFLNKNPENKTAVYKYNKVRNKSIVHEFTTFKSKNNKLLAKPQDGGKLGTIVFTGQSSKRKEIEDNKPSGKVHEFVFLENKNPENIDVSHLKKDFKFIYSDHDKNEISKDWEMWKEKLEKGEKIPIFFNKDFNGKIKHLGLAYMYKLPYENSVKSIEPFKSYKTNLGLPDVIFGTINSKEFESLKGRVFISHAFSENAEAGEKVSEILAGPKASFYPFYLKQDNHRNMGYTTYNDSEAEIRGYKRYPVKNMQTGFYDDKQLKNKKVFTNFIPLKQGAKFKTKIRFHNLKKVELGALISALTFHNNSDKLFHNLGGAKPFGYGKISLTINSLIIQNKSDINLIDYMIDFEKLMGGENWLSSDILNELFLMAKYSDGSLQYPKEPKVFVEYKKDNDKLSQYSEIISPNKFKIQSLIKQKEILENIGNLKFESVKFKDLKKEVKEKGFVEIPEELHNLLMTKITDIYNTNRESKRDLSRKEFFDEYNWYNTISTWLGEEKAKQLFEKLNDREAI